MRWPESSASCELRASSADSATGTSWLRRGGAGRQRDGGSRSARRCTSAAAAIARASSSAGGSSNSSMSAMSSRCSAAVPHSAHTHSRCWQARSMPRSIRELSRLLSAS
eukprot:7049222-Prymnesium_polylepis.2